MAKTPETVQVASPALKHIVSIEPRSLHHWRNCGYPNGACSIAPRDKLKMIILKVIKNASFVSKRKYR